MRPLSDRNAFVLAGANLGDEVDTLVDGIRRGQLSPLRRAGPHPAELPRGQLGQDPRRAGPGMLGHLPDPGRRTGRCLPGDG